VHDVQLNSFCIDLSEVTVAQYDACVKEGACAVAASAVEWVGIQPHDHAVWDGFCNEGKADRATHPINCVAWDQARAFCKHEDKRLPSEAEWELAARGSEGRTFPWGTDRPSATLLNACGTECSSKAKLLDIELSALYPADDGYVSTAPVRSFPAGRTPNGVFDLGGNVSEWTAGSYCPYPGSNCMGELRATRGSSWTSDEMRKTRATARTKTAPTARAADIGFRCAK
jgi:formylglycine-generating enzyme required for sulfatase activity